MAIHQKARRGFLSARVNAMGLKAMLIRIGDKNGIAVDLYNRNIRWNGMNGIVDLMAGTDVLTYCETTRRLQQTYRAF
eukprot:11428087-Prorocentrum_lima.AAC.1